MISPQGYKLGEAPEAKNPFWGEGEDSNVNKIYATATVDDGTGVPSVSTSKTVNGNDITFGFDFHNLKGKDGVGKKGDPGFSPSARVEQTETGATITVTDESGTTTATVKNGKPGVAGVGVPTGGTAGQVLTKKSGADYDTEWKNSSSKDIVKNSVTINLSGTLAAGDTIYKDATISGNGTPCVVGWSFSERIPVSIVSISASDNYVFVEIANPGSSSINLNGAFGLGIQLTVEYIYV